MADEGKGVAAVGDNDPLLSRTERVIAVAVGALIVATLLALVLYNAVALRVLPGEVGVRFSLLFGGTVLDRTIPPGFALKLPWDRVYIYEVRTQRAPFQLRALTRDDMEINLTASALFRPIVDQVPYLQEAIGPEYIERAVAPVSVAAVREAVGDLDAFTLYAEASAEFKAQVMELLSEHPIAQYVDFVDVVITEVLLPPKLVTAIEDKLSQEQLFQSYQHRLQSQMQEAERRRIEAIGVRVFYDIVRQALTPDLLTWRGIEATVQLARSTNSKIVIVGSGKDQLPLILGSEMTRDAVVTEPSGPASEDAGTSLDPFDTDPLSFQVDPEAFQQLPDFRTLPSLFDDSILLPRTERAASTMLNDTPDSPGSPAPRAGRPTAAEP
ncbi:MAG: prohibitin family protein [Pseudomonadota bacterium]